MRKRIAYSQNFLKDKNLIANLIGKSSITKNDTVYDIGAGQGIITDELSKVSGKVTAFEIDKNLYSKLSQRLRNQNVELRLGNFLDFPLPSFGYKVFSNIPFNITSAVIKKLTEAPNPPLDTYLIVQKEAAEKFLGKPYNIKNSQLATQLKPWFDMTVVYNFAKNDFFPKPMVDIVLIRIEKRKNPLIDPKDKQLYDDFVTYSYSQFQPNIVEGLSKVIGRNTMTILAKQVGFNPNGKPSELEEKTWYGIFDYFIKNVDDNHKRIVKGSYTLLRKQQQNLQKINRTRLDKNWKSKSNYS